MVELFPEGFEEVESEGGLQLAAYTDEAGEELLRAAFGSVSALEVADDWAERWRAFHHGVQVGELWVGPPWQAAPREALAVVVDPGQAFGTGAHPTTRLCLELLQLLPRGSLVDVGCGSGVLALAAARLGFAPVVALDSDPAAVEATRENASRNDVRLEVQVADALAGPLPATDVAVANLTGEAIPWLPLRSSLAVTSGYPARERIGLPAYSHHERRTLEGWAADLFTKN